MRARLLPLLALVVLLASACSVFTRSIEKPSASVQQVSMGAFSLTSAEGVLKLDVLNPNGFGVPLSGIQWELSIGGARAVTGQVELSQTIPARGTAPVVTNLRVDARDVATVATQLARGARSYQLAARLSFSTPVGPITVDVRHQGTLGGDDGLVGRF